MTLENAKRLYAHYIKKEMKEEAADLLDKVPELEKSLNTESKSKK